MITEYCQELISGKSRPYREILNHHFESRRSKNPAYSVRAFARDLKVSASQLSEVLNGKRNLSRLNARLVAQSIGYNRNEQYCFADLVECEAGRSEQRRMQAKIRIRARLRSDQFQLISEDIFKMISEWYHMAILELVELQNFRFGTAIEIAVALGITKIECELAMDRLQRLQLMKLDPLEGWRVQPFHKIGSEIPSSAIRELHNQILNKASAALEHQAIDRREFSSTFIKIARSDLGAAKEKLREFRKNFSSDLATKNRDAVYCLSMQFFDLTETVTNATD